MTIEANAWNKRNSSWREMVNSSSVTVNVATKEKVAFDLATAGVTNAMLADMAQSTIKGRAAGAGTGVPTDLTATQATAILDNVVGDSGSGGTKGLVPAPGSGDAAAGKFLSASGAFSVPGSGLTLLTSAVIATVTSVSIVLTAATSYRGIMVLVSNFVPVTDGTDLWLRTSTDGGANYDSGAGSYAWTSALCFTTVVAAAGSASDVKIVLNRNDAANQHVSNVASEGGISTTLLLTNQTATGWRTGIQVLGGTYASDATGQAAIIGGSGVRLTAADVDGLQLLFSTGSIASGRYGVYGLI